MLNTNQIKNLIPHRFPILLVDKVVGYEKDKSIVGIKNISTGDELLKETDKGLIYPTGLIIESIGQLCAILFSLSKNNNVEFILGSINGVRILQEVYAGSRLDLNASIIRIEDDFVIMKGKATLQSNVVLDIEQMIIKINRR
ncbi:MAG: hypothetical protein AUJ97_07250 [Bacteroidetes bacterium CG2_30_32_10]|nr:MAG: hypothetical protein AUJ97_07250 [Bacteroidetes bacterium CG2_30_32_10]